MNGWWWVVLGLVVLAGLAAVPYLALKAIDRMLWHWEQEP